MNIERSPPHLSRPHYPSNGKIVHIHHRMTTQPSTSPMNYLPHAPPSHWHKPERQHWTIKQKNERAFQTQLNDNKTLTAIYIVICTTCQGRRHIHKRVFQKQLNVNQKRRGMSVVVYIYCEGHRNNSLNNGRYGPSPTKHNNTTQIDEHTDVKVDILQCGIYKWTFVKLFSLYSARKKRTSPYIKVKTHMNFI